jgi:hypothetical protein
LTFEEQWRAQDTACLADFHARLANPIAEDATLAGSFFELGQLWRPLFPA